MQQKIYAYINECIFLYSIPALVCILTCCLLFSVFFFFIHNYFVGQDSRYLDLFFWIILLLICMFYFLILVLFLWLDFSVLPYQISWCIFSERELVFGNLFLFIDGVSLLFILLLAILMPICLCLNVFIPFQLFYVRRLHNNKSVNFTNFYFSNENFFYCFLLFLLCLILFFFFTVSDIFFFYVFFEASMIPLYFMIGLFGSRVNRVKASYYLFFFTVIGSFLFLISILLLKWICGSTDLFVLHSVLDSSSNWCGFVWFGIFLSLSVKVPIFPFHIWLPEAHVEASTEGSVLLAGLLLKVGLYGMFRFLLPLFGSWNYFFLPMITTLGLIGIIYVSVIIFIQVDFKKIIAYSSIIHMNYAMMGLFSGTVNGVHGSVYLMFTHGLISSGLFIVVGILYSRFYTRIVSHYQGLGQEFSVLGSLFFLFLLGNMGFPGTGGFVGEFLIIVGLFQINWFVGFLSLLGLFFGVIYSLLLYVRIFFGSYAQFYDNKAVSAFGFLKDNNSDLSTQDCNYKFIPILFLEYIILLWLAVFVIYTGIFPKFYLNLIESSVVYSVI